MVFLASTFETGNNPQSQSQPSYCGMGPCASVSEIHTLILMLLCAKLNVFRRLYHHFIIISKYFAVLNIFKYTLEFNILKNPKNSMFFLNQINLSLDPMYLNGKQDRHQKLYILKHN